MNDRAGLWHAAAEAAEQGAVAALATVARKRGSLPLSDDAKMLVTANGERLGTVGGGCVEAEVTSQALATVAVGLPVVVKHTLNADLAGDVGLSCGGTVELFLEPLLTDAPSVRLYREVGQAIERRREVTVLTSVDWSRRPQKSLRDGADRRSSFVDEMSSLFVEPIPRAPRVIVFGAGHVGVEIVRLAAGAGFHVIGVDDRDEFANPERLPWAAEVLAEDLGAVLDRLILEPDDFVIAATRGHSFDANVIERTAGSAAGYVGMLGSKRKLAVVRRALEAAGVAPAALDRVRCPIGEDIGADTPAEIAVSVVAELIRVRRRSAQLSE
jgi:xanthine dehydrogenase accessory factor